MSLFDASYHTDHKKITELILKLEVLRDDLEEINRSDLLEDIDPFLIHRIQGETGSLLGELQLMEENISDVEFDRAAGDQ